MALVEYSDSDESDTSNAQSQRKVSQQLKRKRDDPTQDLPPLPSTFHDLYSSTVRLSTQDDPALHGGKERLKPHVDGQWPSHIYVEWCPSRTESRILTDVLNSLTRELSRNSDTKINSLVESELGAGLPLHISLSAPMMLLTEQRQGVLDAIEGGLCNSSIRPFKLEVTDLRWVANYESTRWFLVLGIQRPESNELNRLLQVFNQVASKFEQPSLYAPSPQVEDRATGRGRGRGRGNRGRGGRGRGGSHVMPRHIQAPRPSPVPDHSSCFHISIAWTLKPPSTELQAALAKVAASELPKLLLQVQSIKVKIGNAISVFRLLEKARASKGIFGT